MNKLIINGKEVTLKDFYALLGALVSIESHINKGEIGSAQWITRTLIKPLKENLDDTEGVQI